MSYLRLQTQVKVNHSKVTKRQRGSFVEKRLKSRALYAELVVFYVLFRKSAPRAKYYSNMTPTKRSAEDPPSSPEPPPRPSRPKLSIPMSFPPRPPQSISSTKAPSKAASERMQSSKTESIQQKVTKLTAEDLKSYNEYIAAEYATRLQASTDEDTRRTREVFELEQTVENRTKEGIQLKKDLDTFKNLADENAQLKRDLDSLGKQHETTLSKNLDIGIQVNSLRYELEKAAAARNHLLEVIDKQGKVIELARKATLNGEIPWKTFLEAADELKGAMEQAEQDDHEE